VTDSVPGTELPPANRARIARATQSLIVCGVCLVVEVGVAVRSPNALVIVNTIVTALECVLAWLARVAYGWLKVTPGRVATVKVIRRAPVTLAIVGGVLFVALAAAGLAGSPTLMWVMTSFVVMMVGAAAAGVAGAAR